MKKRFSSIAAVMLLLTACSPDGTSANSAETIPLTDGEPVVIDEPATLPLTDGDPVVTGVEYNIASLKGPTTMGMVKLMSDSEAGMTLNKYNVSVYATADEIVTGVVSGNTDIANVPANLAAVLYNKTEGAIDVAAVNTLSLIHI